MMMVIINRKLYSVLDISFEYDTLGRTFYFMRYYHVFSKILENLCNLYTKF